MVAQKDLRLDQGATWRPVLRWQAGSPATPVDLTGCTARLHVRASHAAPDPPVLALTTENGGITLGGGDGTITLEASATTTTALTPGRYVYDLEIVHPSGRVTRLVGGALIITPEVTR